MVTLEQLREGSKVYVRGAFGTGPEVLATVVEVSADIKNGRPGIDYRVEGQRFGNWAYLDQVQAVYQY